VRFNKLNRENNKLILMGSLFFLCGAEHRYYRYYQKWFSII